MTEPLPEPGSFPFFLGTCRVHEPLAALRRRGYRVHGTPNRLHTPMQTLQFAEQVSGLRAHFTPQNVHLLSDFAMRHVVEGRGDSAWDTLQRLRSPWRQASLFFIEISSLTEFPVELPDGSVFHANNFTVRDMRRYAAELAALEARGLVTGIPEPQRQRLSAGRTISIMRRIKRTLRNRPVVWVSHARPPAGDPAHEHVIAMRSHLANVLRRGAAALGDGFFDPSTVAAEMGKERFFAKGGADLNHLTAEATEAVADRYLERMAPGCGTTGRLKRPPPTPCAPATIALEVGRSCDEVGRSSEAAAACGAIESHLLTATGRTQQVRYVGDLFPGKTQSRRIHYSVYQWGEIELFVKRAPRLRLNPRVERALNEMNSPFVRTPTFFGSGRSGGSDFAIWERLDLPWIPRFESVTLDGLFRIVDAIAAVNAATEVVTAADPGVRRATLWMKPRGAETGSELLGGLEPEISPASPSWATASSRTTTSPTTTSSRPSHRCSSTGSSGRWAWRGRASGASPPSTTRPSGGWPALCRAHERGGPSGARPGRLFRDGGDAGLLLAGVGQDRAGAGCHSRPHRQPDVIAGGQRLGPVNPPPAILADLLDPGQARVPGDEMGELAQGPCFVGVSASEARPPGATGRSSSGSRAAQERDELIVADALLEEVVEDVERDHDVELQRGHVEEDQRRGRP